MTYTFSPAGVDAKLYRLLCTIFNSWPAEYSILSTGAHHSLANEPSLHTDAEAETRLLGNVHLLLKVAGLEDESDALLHRGTSIGMSQSPLLRAIHRSAKEKVTQSDRPPSALLGNQEIPHPLGNQEIPHPLARGLQGGDISGGGSGCGGCENIGHSHSLIDLGAELVRTPEASNPFSPLPPLATVLMTLASRLFIQVSPFPSTHTQAHTQIHTYILHYIQTFSIVPLSVPLSPPHCTTYRRSPSYRLTSSWPSTSLQGL